MTSVRDLEVHGDDLVIATHGRAFWILDNLAPSPGRPGGRGRATRGCSGCSRRPRPSACSRRFRRHAFPGRGAGGDNPPFGAAIDYFLPRAAEHPVELEVRDERGELVRRYSSADRPKPVDLGKIGSAPEWVPVPSTLEATPGFHRFYWPIRLPRPAALATGDPFADGVWAPPAEYRVELVIDGARFAQSLTVAADPRVTLPEAYRAQFALAREIDGERARLAGVGEEIDQVLKGLATTLQTLAGGGRRARNGRLAGELALRDRLLILAGKAPAGSPANAWWLGARERASIQFAAGQLANLAEAVDGADAAPSPEHPPRAGRHPPARRCRRASLDRHPRQGAASPRAQAALRGRASDRPGTASQGLNRAMA